MKKADIKKMMIHLLKKDPDFCNDCYTEWEYNCNQYKVIAFDEKGEIKKMRKKTYHEICKETIEDALEQMPPEIRKGNAEEVEDFLIEGWLFSLFNEHNNTNNR